MRNWSQEDFKPSRPGFHHQPKEERIIVSSIVFILTVIAMMVYCHNHHPKNQISASPTAVAGTKTK